MQIVLIGYMGSGKSTIGKLLSHTINFDFIDLDQYIELQEDRSISRIFLEGGEIYFRRKEKEYLSDIIERKSNAVISLGGGTPCYSNIISILNSMDGVITIYLDTPLRTLTQRLYKEMEKRPLISHLKTEEALHDFIRKHLFERSYYYNQAKIKVATADKDVKSIVEDIIAKLF